MEKPHGPGKYILGSIPYFVSYSYVFPNKATLSGPVKSWVTGVFGSMEMYN